MKRITRRGLTGLAVTGLLAGALAGGGAALASTGSGGQATTVAAVAQAAPAASTAAPAAGHRGGTRFLRRKHAARLVLRTSASYLGLTPAELRTQLRAGKSLAAVATSQGKSVSGLESVILAAAVKRIDASKLTAARKATLIGDVKANVNAFVTDTHPFKRAAHRLGKAVAPAASPTATATAQAAV